METTTPLETEIKIPVSDLKAVRVLLENCEATCVQMMARESNTLYDTAEHQITQKGHTLRLRSFAGRSVVTHKGTMSYLGSIKIREELEVLVDDLDTFGAILGALGFEPSIRYEKDREEWRLEGMLITLDHTPMGDFVEIEGPVSTIPKIAERLELDLDDAVRGSYLSLWLEYRHQRPDQNLGRNMVFAT